MTRSASTRAGPSSPRSRTSSKTRLDSLLASGCTVSLDMDGERTNLIPIGQFSLLTRLTVRALRLYDKLGILVPAHVDPDSGYRYYAAEQAKLAAHIGRLRAIDLPLDEVRFVLETPVQLTRSLELHASRLRGRRDEAEQALDLLRSIQKGIEPLNVPIEIRDVEPTRGISIE